MSASLEPGTRTPPRRKPTPWWFHARHLAVARSYLISRRRTAFAKPYVWWVKDALDSDRIRQAAALFLGMHDFRSFTAGDPEESSTRVLLDRLEVGEEADLILIRIQGSHFIWKMVRRVMSVLAEVGHGDLSLREVERFLREDSETPARLTAPPSGLFLERVFDEGDPRDFPLRAASIVSSSPRP